VNDRPSRFATPFAAPLLLAIAASLVTTSARGGDEGPLPEVEIAVVGDAAGANDLGSRIGSWFQKEHVRVETSRLANLVPDSVLAPPPRAGVHVWIAILAAKRARVFFTVRAQEGDSPRYLVTEIAIEDGLDEIGVERIGQIVYLSATGLWAGNLESTREEIVEELHKSRGAAPAPAAPPSPETALRAPAPPSSEVAGSIGLRAGFEYAARWRGDAGIAHLLGGSIGAFQKRSSFELGGLLHVAMLLPGTARASGVEVVTQGVAFAAGVAGERAITRRARACAEIGAGAEAVRYRTDVTDATLRPSEGGTDVQPFALSRAGMRFDLGAVALGLDALVVVELLRTHYDVASTVGRAEIVVPWRVQPGLAAGASW
jgi:hypothetical protein